MQKYVYEKKRYCTILTLYFAVRPLFLQILDMHLGTLLTRTKGEILRVTGEPYAKKLTITRVTTRCHNLTAESYHATNKSMNHIDFYQIVSKIGS